MWTEESTRARIAELEADLGWYQNIDLGGGIQTKTTSFWGEEMDHPATRWNYIKSAVPDDMSGMSVLDIGCNAGFIAFEVKRRGAEYVCGVDLKQGYIDQANFCNDVLGYDVDFRVLDIYDLEKLGRQFDLVFFVGLLYHCKYLSLAVEQVSNVTKTKVISESAIYPEKSKVPLVRFIRSSQYKGPQSKGESRLPGHWHPNMTAYRDLFYENGFSKVEELFKTKGRGGIVAER